MDCPYPEPGSRWFPTKGSGAPLHRRRTVLECSSAPEFVRYRKQDGSERTIRFANWRAWVREYQPERIDDASE